MSNRRRNARRLLLHFSFYYSLALGITTMRLDYDQRRVIKSRLWTIYAFGANLTLIASMPFVVRIAFNYADLMEENEIMQVADVINIVIRFGVMLLTMLARLRRERRFQAMAREFFALDARFFDRKPPNADIERRFDYVFFAKFITTCGQTPTAIFETLQLTRIVNVTTLALAVYISNIQNIIHGVLFHYFSALWQICKRFHVLNAELRRLLHSLQQLHGEGGHVLHPRRSFTLLQLSRLAAADLCEISQLHLRLMKSADQLNDSYKYQMMALLLTYVLHTVTYGYVAVLMLDGSLNMEPPSVWAMLIGALSYGFFIADLYLFYWMCDATVAASSGAAEILKEFHVLPAMDAAFERHCELFSMQLMQHKLRISMGGMFTLDKRTALLLVTFILQHTIIMVQFDYENRWKLLKANVALLANDLI